METFFFIGAAVVALLLVVHYFVITRPKKKAEEVRKVDLRTDGYRSRTYLNPIYSVSTGTYRDYTPPSALPRTNAIPNVDSTPASVQYQSHNDSTLNMLTTLMAVDTLLDADDAYDRHFKDEPKSESVPSSSSDDTYKSSVPDTDTSWSSKSDDSGWNRSDSTDYSGGSSSTDYGSSSSDSSSSSSSSDW